jgi:hypothetical protein
MARTSYRVHCWLRLRLHRWETLGLVFGWKAAQQRCRSCGVTRIKL